MLTSTSKFFEDNKIVRARALEKCSSAYYTKLQENSRYCLIIIYMKKKNHSRAGQTKFWNRGHCLQFSLVLQVCTRVTWECNRFKPIRSLLFFQCMLVSNKRRVFVRPLKSAFKLTNKHDFISLQLEQYRRQACTWLSLFWCCSFVRDLRGNRISRIAEGTFEKLFSLKELWVFYLCRVSECFQLHVIFYF